MVIIKCEFTVFPLISVFYLRWLVFCKAANQSSPLLKQPARTSLLLPTSAAPSTPSSTCSQAAPTSGRLGSTSWENCLRPPTLRAELHLPSPEAAVAVPRTRARRCRHCQSSCPNLSEVRERTGRTARREKMARLWPACSS